MINVIEELTIKHQVKALNNTLSCTIIELEMQTLFVELKKNIRMYF